jgi:nitrate/nitrite transporter NarK
VLGGALADHFGARLPIGISAVGYLMVAVTLFFMPAVRNEAR